MESTIAAANATAARTIASGNRHFPLLSFLTGSNVVISLVPLRFTAVVVFLFDRNLLLCFTLSLLVAFLLLFLRISFCVQVYKTATNHQMRMGSEKCVGPTVRYIRENDDLVLATEKVFFKCAFHDPFIIHLLITIIISLSLIIQV